MSYKIFHGNVAAVAQARETATAALELVKQFQAEKKQNIKIIDRNGSELTIADLEKLSEKENI